MVHLLAQPLRRAGARGAEPIAGLPSGLQAQRRALIDRANEVSEAVASTGAALQHLQQRAQEALSPLIAQLTTLTTELSRGAEVAAKVKEAQAIRGDVHGQVLRLRRAGLPPETFDRVATESFAFQGNQLAPKPQVGAFANAVWQTVNLLQNVGSGLSYKGAADWLRGNTDTMVAWQHREADKVAIRAFLTALATDLDAR